MTFLDRVQLRSSGQCEVVQVDGLRDSVCGCELYAGVCPYHGRVTAAGRVTEFDLPEREHRDYGSRRLRMRLARKGYPMHDMLTPRQRRLLARERYGR